jgi:DNA polymerase III subunit gamma/tau
MKMHELVELRTRLWSAKTHGFKVGAAAGLVASLEAMVGPVGVEHQRGSVDHLIALVEKAIKAPSAPVHKPAPAPKPAPAAAKPAPAPAAKPAAPAPAKPAAPKPAEAPKPAPKEEAPAAEEPAKDHSES